MEIRKKNLLISLIITIIYEIIIVAIANSSIGATSTSFNRMIILVGGQWPAGIIQAITYFLFFYGFMSILTLSASLKEQTSVFNDVEKTLNRYDVMNRGDLLQMQMYLDDMDKNNQLVDLLTKVNSKVLATESVSEALAVLSTQVRINKDNEEGKQSLIRYVTWAIPSVGFIGTVIGIAASLGLAEQAINPEVIKAVTDALNIAFDTTLVALVLNVGLMLYYHIYQEKVDKNHNNMEANIMHFFINKINL